MNMGIDITGGIQVEYAVTGGSVDTIIAEKDAIIQMFEPHLMQNHERSSVIRLCMELLELITLS